MAVTQKHYHAYFKECGHGIGFDTPQYLDEITPGEAFELELPCLACDPERGTLRTTASTEHIGPTPDGCDLCPTEPNVGGTDGNDRPAPGG